LHLRPDSPAIQAGIPVAGYKKDVDRNPVPSGKSPDVGAYEFERQGSLTDRPQQQNRLDPVLRSR
jgi:hypothetical protein